MQIKSTSLLKHFSITFSSRMLDELVQDQWKKMTMSVLRVSKFKLLFTYQKILLKTNMTIAWIVENFRFFMKYFYYMWILRRKNIYCGFFQEGKKKNPLLRVYMTNFTQNRRINQLLHLKEHFFFWWMWWTSTIW